MRNINILIKQNVDVKKGIEISKSIELYEKLIDQFLENIGNIKYQINNALLENKLNEYAKLVENLKIQAKNIGFSNLSTIALQHEINAKTNDFEYIRNNYDELLMSLEKTSDIIEEYQKSNDEKIIEEKKENNKKILVSDDSTIVRNLIKKMVKEEYELIEAEDGQMAINILKEQSENIFGMFLDLNMPNVSGFEVLEHLSNNNLFEKISVSIITGDDSKETVMKAFDYPIVDVLAKPFNENDVKRVITAMLTHK